MYFSGCNYWKNRGINEFEPSGTATSMHECGDCVNLNRCKVKKTTELWPFNEEIEKQMNEDFRKMQQI